MAEPPQGANQLASGSTMEAGRVWCSEGTLQGLEGQARWEVTNICWVPGTAAKNLEMLPSSSVFQASPNQGTC